MEIANLKVEKNDGTQEAWDHSKLTGGMMKSGATSEEAEKVAAEIEQWALTANVNGVVKTVDIRTKLLEVLKGVNPTAGATFEAYKKPEVTESPAPVEQPPVAS